MENSTFEGPPTPEVQAPDSEFNPTLPLHINPEGKSYLITTAKWSAFIAIVGFVMIGIMLFGSISAFIISPIVGEYQDFQMLQYLPMPFMFFGLFYLIMAIIMFFPYFYLYLFSQKIKKGMQTDDQFFLNEGLKNLKKLAKFVGIVTVVSLAIMVLIIPIIIFSVGVTHALSGGMMV